MAQNTGASALSYAERRGTLLTILIVIQFISTLQLTIIRALALLQAPALNMIALLLIEDLLMYIFLVGAWRGKKKAIIGLIVLFVFQILTSFSTYISQGKLAEAMYIPIILPLIWAVLWAWAIRSRWHKFN